MGSFVGHALPGSFFLIFGVWWTIRIFMRYFESLTRRGDPYINTPLYPPRLRSRPRLNLEALLVAVMAGLGIFVEIVAACFMRKLPVGITNGQHATMYFFFGLAGFLCLTLPYVQHALPGVHGDAQYLGLLLAYAVEAMLFKFHLFGREGDDIFIHTLLLYAAYACVLATAMEMAYKRNMLASLTRAFFTILQGTWFWQTGFFLYNPLKDPWGHESHHHDDQSDKPAHEDHTKYMVIVLIFAWHMAVIFMLTLVTGALIGWRYRSRGDLDENKILLQTRFSEPPNGYSVVQNNVNDDDL